jgi:mitotic-spindle organizing protein 1
VRLTTRPMNTPAAARETLDIAHDISKLLDCGLDREQLAILIALVEHGVNPEALAAVVRELRRSTTTTATKTKTKTTM